MMSNQALSFNDHFFCTGWQSMPVFVFNIIYKPLLTSGTRVFLFNIILTEVDTFTSITHHYSNAITQFITQFITQIPLLKSLLIITQMSFSLLIITPPLLKGHFADVGPQLSWPWPGSLVPWQSRRRFGSEPRHWHCKRPRGQGWVTTAFQCSCHDN